MGAWLGGAGSGACLAAAFHPGEGAPDVLDESLASHSDALDGVAGDDNLAEDAESGDIGAAAFRVEPRKPFDGRQPAEKTGLKQSDKVTRFLLPASVFG